MEDQNISISLKCLFCDCALEGDAEQDFSSGDLIKCQECDELNDYDAVIELAKEEGTKIISEYAKSEIKKMFKDVFK